MSDITFHPLGNPVAAGQGLGRVADIDARLTRTHYFDGRLLTAEDLTRDQLYLDQRLREVGRVLGSGVMAGLELSYDRYSGLLTLQPGQALTPAGRVLELGSRLSINLGDRALIARLNDGAHRRFNRGLYAVVLRYAEVGTDIAEVFPRDLGARRGFQYALVTESVQMGLVPLPLPLPQQSPLQIRCRLLREFFGGEQFAGIIPEDAVPLGVLAVQNDSPQWLDAELLRRPLRGEPRAGDLQADLCRQYENILADILTARRSGGLSGDFQATDYFSLLPPAGLLPKDAVDPVNGRQGYFPENYQVAIAPIRQSDVALIRAESLGLPAIDLVAGEPVDVVVLVPLNNLDYGHYAARLERRLDPASRRLPQLDLLKLRLHPVRPVHDLDTDRAAWTDIWARLGDNQPFYVRRPTRAAETGISSIVLALGAGSPQPPETGESGGPADGGGLVQDADALFLERLNLKNLAELRPPLADEGREALEKLAAGFGKDAAAVQLCASILMRVERRFDGLVWQTLFALAENERLNEFLRGLVKSEPDTSTAKLVAGLAADLGLAGSLASQWEALAA